MTASVTYEAGPDISSSLTWEDPLSGVYKKLLFSLDGKRLMLSGILVGDAVAYSSLSIFADHGRAASRFVWCQSAGSAIDLGRSRGEWFASQNMCPHRKAFVLSHGMIGDAAGTPKVACPMHKKTFSLQTGDSLQGEEYSTAANPVTKCVRSRSGSRSRSCIEFSWCCVHSFVHNSGVQLLAIHLQRRSLNPRRKNRR